MRLQKLELHNFMAYKGNHIIDFTASDSAPIILFLGENGHGKSTIQYACKWCLYGDTINLNLSDLVNRKAKNEYAGDTSFKMSVTLTWSDHNKVYKLYRYWEPNNSSETTSQPILSTEDGVAFPSNSVSEHVQRFLAKEISHFFFFDGETQKEFDDMASSRKSIGIKEEIEKSLSIPVIADACNWISQKQSEENLRLMKVNSANEKIKEASRKLGEQESLKQRLEEEIQKLERNKLEEQKRLDILSSELDAIAETQALTSEIQTLEAEKKIYATNRSDLLNEMNDGFGEYAWIPLFSKLNAMKEKMQSDLQIIESTHKVNEDLRNKIEYVSRLQHSGTCPICGDQHVDSGNKFQPIVDNLKSQLQSSDESHISELRNKLELFDKFNFKPEIFSKFKDHQKEYDALGSKIAKIEYRIEELNRKRILRGGSGAQEIVANYKAINNEITSIDQSINNENKQLELIQKEIDKHKNAVRKEVPSGDLVTYNAYTYLQLLFKQAKILYTENVKNKVQEYASETFREIISDDKYTGLRINENYGVELVLPDGSRDPLRSTGQGKVSTIALISGLIKTAMDEGFILMDTPFVSLDMHHREAVCEWAAQSGLRVSLFMHSGEFNRDRDSRFFGSSINKIYKIKRIDGDESEVVLETI